MTSWEVEIRGDDSLRLLHKESRHNHEVAVYDTAELYGERGNFRIMQFADGAVQGAIDLDRPERILFEYPRAIIHLMECNNPSFENVFIIGHGVGCIAGHFSEKRVKVAEVDELVVKLSRQYFGYRNNNVIIGDGREILAHEEAQAYDYIVLDAFTDQGTPRHLTSLEFFGLALNKLDSHGSIIMNLMGKGANDRLIHAVHTTLCEEFAYTKAFALPSEGAFDKKNMIIIGRNVPIRYQIRYMAGFVEVEPGQGHVIVDRGRR